MYVEYMIYSRGKLAMKRKQLDGTICFIVEMYNAMFIK